MPTDTLAWTGDRLATIARATLEAERGSAKQDENLGATVTEARKSAGVESCGALLKELKAQLAPAAGGRTQTGTRLGAEDQGQVQELLKQRASVELKLQHETAAKRDVEAALTRQRDEHRHAMESLTFQQQKLKELQEERTRLLGDIRKLEDKLRTQINETEQVNLKLQKLQDSRKTLGDQATGQSEQITALREENELLRQQAEMALRDRDTTREVAKAEVSIAEGQTADAAYAVLWATMGKEIPQLFIPTHVPNQRTFENVSEAFVELVRTMGNIEAHVHKMLRDLRQVGDEGDKLAHFHVMFTKNPNFLATLRDFLTSRKRTGNFANLVKALQSWARAFGSGTYKAVAKSPDLLSSEMNPANWNVANRFTMKKDEVLAKYYRETAHKEIPDKVGTMLRKEAGNMAYQDYNDLMRQR